MAIYLALLHNDRVDLAVIYQAFVSIARITHAASRMLYGFTTMVICFALFRNDHFLIQRTSIKLSDLIFIGRSRLSNQWWSDSVIRNEYVSTLGAERAVHSQDEQETQTEKECC
jgi:hypothetical protein